MAHVEVTSIHSAVDIAPLGELSDDGASMVLAPEAFGAMVGRIDEERASLGRADCGSTSPSSV